MMKRKNPTSPIRQGFNYQDFWSLRLCGDWLISPDKYRWIWFETSPSENLQGGFFLDDIVLLDNHGEYHLYQIKHKQNPEDDAWNWDDFLKQEKGKRNQLKDSLIQKWFKSFNKPDLRDNIGYAAFITNGLAGDDVKNFIKGDKIDIQAIQEKSPELYEKIKAQLENEDNIKEFFNNFWFLFGRSDTSLFESQIRDFFHEKLRATESGVNKLLLQIHAEAGRQHTVPLILEQIKQWCEFDQPRPLNEKFEIPNDFEFFDGIEHKKIFQDLLSTCGGIKVIYGKPGTGKSTYLSKLHDLLRGKCIISIRHHYHISPNDPDPIIRLKTQRVTEALKAQFKEYSEELGELSNKNSGNIQLFEYISVLAEYARTKGNSFVLIIDGLDHVLRQGHDDELKNFLSDICHPQPGLWIVFGMQEIAKKYLPQIVYEKAPEKEWIEIKGLSIGAVDRIFAANSIGLNLPEHRDLLCTLSDKLYQVTKGNPLHLRYTLKQLKNQLRDGLLTEYSFNFLLPYDDDIINYYDSLWRKLPPYAKTVAIIISCVEFQFKRTQLVDLISTFIQNPAEITESLLSISHLMLEKNEKLSVYHNSFRLFLTDQAEYKEQEIRSKRIIRTWLEASEWEDLKWAELRRLSFYLGDAKPILQIDRAWLIDAISSMREPRLITSQLSLGKEAAFKTSRYGKALELSVLVNTFENAPEFIADAWKKIWKVAYRASNHDYLDLNLSELTADQIPVIVKDAADHGDLSILPDATERLNHLHRDLNIRDKGEIGGSLPQVIVSIIETVTLDRQHKHKRLFQYIDQFRSSGWSADLFTLYVDILLGSEDYSKLDDFLKSGFTDLEFQEILKRCAEHDNTSRENRYIDLIFSQQHGSLNYSCLVYLLLREKPITGTPSLPSYDLFPIEVSEYESGKREERSKIFSEIFILGMIYTLQGRETEIKNWISEANDRWALNIMSQLFIAAMDISNEIKANEKINVKGIFEFLTHVPPLVWLENRDLYELQICLQYSLSAILRFLLNIKSYTDDHVELTEDELNCILESTYYNRVRLLDFLLAHKKPLLAKNAYESFISQESEIWQKDITGFPERSERYADLASLANMHRDASQRDIFLKLAADNLLGYGYHKDLFLDIVLESIESCHIAGSKKAAGWITRLAPAIENVTEYTDGDETNYIPKSLAEILAVIDPTALYKYYYQNADDENLFLAQDSFASVIQSLKFEQDIDIALATTALDQRSFEALKSITAGNPNAKKSFDTINSLFGEIEFKKESNESSEPIIRERADYSLIKPEQITVHLSSIKTKYDREQYLANWLIYWLSGEEADKRALYDTSISLIQEDGIHQAEGKILDILYPLAYQYDKEKAFEILCWAQANYGGWDRYFTDKKKAFSRWEFVNKHFRERYMDFFERSILYSGMQYGRGGSYFVPVPRAVEFFALFNNLGIMEEITESAASSIESLMANLQLPESKWVSVPCIDRFDILLQRLSWPSPLVRERAASAIAELLNYGEERQRYFDRFLGFLRDQKLESLIAVALLPVIKALEKGDGLSTYVDLTSLLNAIPCTSIVIEKLVYEISHLLNQETEFKPNRRPALTPPTDYEPHKFFTKHIQGFLAPIYSDQADRIASDTGVNFTTYWAFNSQEMAKELSIKEQVGDAMNFMGYHPPRMLGMSTKLSEVYRSAFLRTVQYFLDKGLIQIDMYHRYLLATLPVELSFWKIKTNRAPGWWPKLQHETGKESYSDEIVKFAFPYDDIEAIVNKNGKTRILGINGTVEPQKGWQEGVSDTSIHLAGFAYKVNGPNIPDPKIVAKQIFYETFIFTVARMLPRPFNILECPKQYLPSQTRPTAIDDMIIYPLIAPVMGFAINLWQWFRGEHPYMLLFKPALDENVLRLEDNGLGYYMNGNLVAYSQDWAEGIQERADLEAPHGTFIEIDTNYLNEYLDGIGFRLGYVMRTSHKFRKYSTDKEQAIEDYRFIGVSQIIT